ncbi:MAG: hypothetical protein ACJAU9_000871 [Lentimonas sp.]|jgi:hypothetical protein
MRHAQFILKCLAFLLARNGIVGLLYACLKQRLQKAENRVSSY